ncbi:deaminase [Staphylococcus aureus]
MSGALPGTGYAATGCTAIHAEANAIIRAGRARTVGATMYVTSEPCDLCSSLLDAAGIARTIWR